jgi:hypothetical protein
MANGERESGVSDLERTMREADAAGSASDLGDRDPDGILDMGKRGRATSKADHTDPTVSWRRQTPFPSRGHLRNRS